MCGGYAVFKRRNLCAETYCKNLLVELLVNGHEKLYYRFGVDQKLDQQILQYLSAQRFRRLKTAYPPHTIVDPGVLIHEMRLHKTSEEVELMQNQPTSRRKRIFWR